MAIDGENSGTEVPGDGIGEGGSAPEASEAGGAGGRSSPPGGLPEAGSELEGAASPEGSEPAARGEAAPASREPAPDWRDKRIAKLAAQRDAAREEATRLRNSTVPASADETRAQAIAAERLAFQTFNQRCQDARTAGDSQYPDFTARINQLVQIYDGDDPSEAQAYNAMLEVALDTGAAPKVLHALSQDLNFARKVMEMPRHKQAIEMTKLALGEARASAAPKPITPVGGRQGGERDRISPSDPDSAERLPTAIWMERRNREVMENRKRGKH